MKNGIGLICALLLWSPVSNAEWKVVALYADESGGTISVDWSTLRVRDDIRRVWVLYNFGKTGNANEYTSSLVLSLFDCAEKRSRDVQIFHYPEPDGRGDSKQKPISGQWIYAPPNTVNAITLKAVCDYSAPWWRFG